MTLTPKCLVLGIGNLLLCDEGVGVHVMRRLGDFPLPAGVDMLDGGTGGFHLLGCFSEHEILVIIDASLNGQPPGTVTVTRPRFASDFPRVLSSHDIGLRDLIESAALIGDLPRMYLIAISIAPNQSMGMELSAPVEASIDTVIQTLQSILQNLDSPDQPPPGEMISTCGDGNA